MNQSPNERDEDSTPTRNFRASEIFDDDANNILPRPRDEKRRKIDNGQHFAADKLLTSCSGGHSIAEQKTMVVVMATKL